MGPIILMPARHVGWRCVSENNENGVFYVPLRPLISALGLDWSSQRKRINRDAILKEEVKGVVITTTPRLWQYEEANCECKWLFLLKKRPTRGKSVKNGQRQRQHGAKQAESSANPP